MHTCIPSSIIIATIQMTFYEGERRVRIETRNTPHGPSLLIAFLLVLTAAENQPIRAQIMSLQIPVIPAPSDVNMRFGACVISSDTPICADTAFRNAAATLSALLSASMPVRLDAPPGMAIRFERSDPGIGAEAYQLTIAASGIVIRASSDAGAFYAVQTLRQMLPSCIEGGSRFRAWRLPCMHIEDAPRFSWRGVLLDCSRHFLPAADVKRIIEQMAALKINRLHWHLTDDQGWRLEIRAYPQLTSVGAHRGEGPSAYGGFYSQAEVRDIVDYAAKRHVTIVPEIDMPGHSTAALASYPWLGCTGMAVPVATEWGIFPTVLCPGRETTYAFVQTVLEEVAELFPSPWIHVGGDECLQDRWLACDSCQASRSRNNLPGIYGMQWLFTWRVEEMLKRIHKVPIGWNEIMTAASKSTIVQAWYHVDVGVKAAEQGFRVICSPIEPNYLNYHQGYNTLQKVYAFDPLSEHVWPKHGESLLGVECCLWAESLPTVRATDRMLFPRVAAFAEAAWTVPRQKDWECFRRRLGIYGGRWNQQGHEFYPIEDVPWDDGTPLTVRMTTEMRQGNCRIEFSTPADGGPLIFSNAVRDFDAIWVAPKVLHQDSLEIRIEYGYTSPDYLDSYTIQRLYKRSNPWMELADSTSSDGLYHLPPELKRIAPVSMQCFPNPLRASAGGARLMIRFTVSDPGPVELCVFDEVGRPVLSRYTEPLYFGTHLISFDLGDRAAGSYFIQLRFVSGVSVAAVRILP